MPNALIIYAIVIAAIFGGGFWCGSSYVQNKWDANKAAYASAMLIQSNKTAKETAEHGREIADKINAQNIQQSIVEGETNDAIHKNSSVYDNCKLSADGVRAYNNAVAAAGPTSTSRNAH